MAHCKIYGAFKDNAELALKEAQSMGGWGACSYSTEPIGKSWDKTIPQKEGDITFELFGRAPFDKLHKIAKAICELGKDYRISVSEWEL